MRSGSFSVGAGGHYTIDPEGEKRFPVRGQYL